MTCWPERVHAVRLRSRLTVGAFCIGLGALVGCANVPTSGQRQQTADDWAATRGWQARQVPAGAFDLMTYAPATPATATAIDTLVVYLEGDGLAWVSPSQPSTDPTPANPLALRLALAHPEGAAAYLARPCQYVAASFRGCEARYWTQQRFAPEVIAASSLALDALKARFQARQLVLVGYSGGGAVAALVAARRTDVVRLITVAGNLDHRAWTALHRVTPLSGSLNPADERAALKHLPQWHLAGGADRVVPPAIAQEFISGFAAPSRPQVIVMPGYTHACCWAEHWAALWPRLQ